MPSIWRVSCWIATTAEIRFRYPTQEVSGQAVTSYLIDGEMASGAAVHLSIYPASGMNVERVTVYCTDQAFELACSNGLDAPGWLRRYQENRLAEEINGAQLAGSSESYMLNGFYAEDEALLRRRAGRPAAARRSGLSAPVGGNHAGPARTPESV